MADIQKVITGSEISIVAYGNLRTTWNPGKLPRYKLQDMLPYGNNICSFSMNGNELKKGEIFEEGYTMTF
jgi:2',3'-cyclic-nucleotide 2'-phosphodiesterase (5'-nucleotidase family)